MCLSLNVSVSHVIAHFLHLYLHLLPPSILF